MRQLRRRFVGADVWYSLLVVGLIAGLASLATLAWAYIIVVTFGIFSRTPTTPIASAPAFQAALDTLVNPWVNPVTSLFLAAALAAGCLAPLAWWFVIIWPDSLSPMLGAGAGALVGFVAHPLMWGIWSILVVFASPPSEDPLINILVCVLVCIPTVLVGSFFSILLAGWLTVAVGAAGGSLIATAQETFGCRHRWRMALG